MRILMVSDVYFPRINGVSTSIETFRRALATQGVEVRLVAPDYGQPEVDDGVIRVPGRPVPGDPEDRLVGWWAMHATVRQAAINCDLIHIQTPFVAHYAGLKAARRFDLPVVATYHTLFEECLEHYVPFLPAGWLRAQARSWSRRQCNALDAVIVPSSAMEARLAGYGVTQPMEVIPTGIPLRQFEGGDRAAFRSHLGIDAERPLALFVGRLSHEKNIGFLLEAMRYLRESCPRAVLLITGEGPAMPDLQRTVQDLGLSEQVRFLGYLDRERELPDCYAAADVFAFASPNETQGLVLIEAMAAGLPVIALSAMGTADILEPRQGALVPAGAPEEFAAAMARIFANPQERLRLAENAREYAKLWSDSAMAARQAALYRQLIQLRQEGKAWKARTKAKPA